jgi:hypothetical protein
MTIRIKRSSIEFQSPNGNTYTISEVSDGFVFDGRISFVDNILSTGYTSGGYSFPVSTYYNVIDKFPFAVNANATDVGDLTVSRSGVAGQSSTVSGYTSGGYTPPNTYSNVIDKFPFSANANATDVGDLTVGRWYSSGQSSTISGYTSGGLISAPYPTSFSNVIDKYPFAANANATDVGDLTVSRLSSAGQSSTVSGYSSGGATVGGLYPNASNVIDKFPFSANANATDVGDLSVTRSDSAGQSSTVSGYTSGGVSGGGPPYTVYNVIDKFPFSVNANATDVGDLSITKSAAAGQSSTVSGYTSGGASPPSTPAYSNVIDRFPFSTDANATDVGDLTFGRNGVAGQQV